MVSIKFLVLLGVLQGLTEFLPISSSGHLVIAQSFIPGFRQPGVLLDVNLHLGTLVALLVYFRRDFTAMFFSLLDLRHARDSSVRRLMWLLVVGSVPTALIGILFRRELELLFSKVSVAGGMLLVTGSLLFATDRVQGEERELKEMRISDALAVGLAQGLALVPGISRSGATIAVGLLVGLERELALRYSFLLSVPVILGAFVIQIMVHAAALTQSVDVLGYGAGVAAAFLVGYASIAVLLRMLLSRRLSFFAYYCWVVGITVLLLESLSPLF
ncbi:MAG: undecaprenyl-diphosphate phosphatase [Candidatus Binatia bacterium]